MGSRLFTMLMFFIVLATVACEQKPLSSNPPAEGFLAEKSDKKAIEIADAVMETMGGRKAWDETKMLRWTFFGRRSWHWEKNTGNVRLEIPSDTTTIISNIHSGKTKVYQFGREIKNEALLDSMGKMIKESWINDSYWLVMPYKLKDSGVSLKYVGTAPDMRNVPCHVLSLTFENTGITPEDKYLVYVEKEKNIISQWDFYDNAMDGKAKFSTPWADYKRYGKILLSGNRGEFGLTDIAVYDEYPQEMFQLLNFNNL